MANNGVQFFSFSLPIADYKRLKFRAMQADIPMAELLRQGVRLVLESGERVGLKKPCV